MARRRKGRPVDGIVLLDKPIGMSSNDVLQKVKRIYNAAKAGHTGALDPLATGMLPICLGEATKFSQFLLESDKRYRVIARLGQRTSTSDADGEIIDQRPVNISQQQITDVLEKFRGVTDQTPSMYSALKYQGKPLYEYARQGINIPRESRKITVYQLEQIHFYGDELELEIHCSKGTYIRTIIDDLGELLGCGAHVIYLRRLQVADYPIEKMVTLQQLNQLCEKALQTNDVLSSYLDPLLLPMDSAVKNLFDCNITPSMAAYVKQGQAVLVPGAPFDGLVRITVGPQHEFIGIGEIDTQGMVAPRRLVVDAETRLLQT